MTREERQKAKDTLIKSVSVMAVTQEEFNDYIHTLNQLMDWLEQEPKTGHWIEEIDDYGKIMRWHCDKCYEDSGFTTTCKWDFCPNCGAEMDKCRKRGINNAPLGLFGKRCRIKHVSNMKYGFVYRIINDGIQSFPIYYF